MKNSEPKIFFNTNVKFLRQRKKLSQETFAEMLSITRPKLAAIETGHTKAPQPADLLRISDYFKISIDSLLRIDLSTIGELKLRELEAGNDVYIKGGNLRVLAITVDKSNRENVEYVPIKAKAGYAAGYNDPKFIADLPKYTLPNLAKERSYRIFPTIGDSMLPIPENSEIVASFVQDWTTIKDQTLCVVILREQQDFVFKQVTLKGDAFLLSSLNTQYEPYTVPVSEVLEIWEFERYFSSGLPEQNQDLQTIARSIRALQDDMEILKKK
jgi:transcriptional regulator with XRE-family HTH domain